jgi:hypothetical protein
MVVRAYKLQLFGRWQSGESQFEASPGKVSKIPSQPISWSEWCVFVIPATWEVQIGEWQSISSWGKNGRPYLKNN